MIYTVEICRRQDTFVKGPFRTKEEAEQCAIDYHNHLSSAELRELRRGERSITVMTHRDQEQADIGDAEDTESIEEILGRVRPSEVETVARVTTIGTSLGLYLTEELRQLGLDRGDHVRVTLERLD